MSVKAGPKPVCRRAPIEGPGLLWSSVSNAAEASPASEPSGALSPPACLSGGAAGVGGGHELFGLELGRLLNCHRTRRAWASPPIRIGTVCSGLKPMGESSR